MYLSLGGIHIANNSNVSFYGIGEGDGGALLCVTDLMQCCHRKNTTTGRALGWWFYPDGSDVPTYEYHNIYRDRGRNIVRLNHRNHTHVEPTGLYCCEVPDSTFIAQSSVLILVSLYIILFVYYHQHPIQGNALFHVHSV